jgi:hypothetical protein
MPIQVQGPDGQLLEFPDGTPRETMKAAMQKRYGAPQPQEDIPTLPAVQAEAPDPTDDMSGLDRFRAGMGKAFVDTARGLKQAGTDAARYFVEEGLGMEAPGLRESLARQQAEIDAASERDRPLMNTGAGVAGNVGGYAATILVPGAIATRGTMTARALLPTTIRGNAAQGGLLGLTQSVESGGSRLGNAGMGAAFGGGGAGLVRLLGAGGNAARSGLADLVQKAKIGPSAQRAGQVMRQEAGDGLASLMRPAESAVPGVTRTLGEQSLDPGTMALENAMRAKYRGQFDPVDMRNNVSRVEALRNIAGDDAAMADAISARSQAASAARDGAMKADDVNISETVALVDDLIRQQEGRPGVQAGLRQVRDLLAKDVEGAPGLVTTEPVSNIAVLDNVRMTLGDMLSGKYGGENAQQLAGSRALLTVRDSLNEEIGRQVPEFTNYLNAYRQNSVPINRMELGRDLIERGSASVRDATGTPRLMPGTFAKANDLDTMAQKATGFGKAKASDILTPDDLKLISAVQDDLQRQFARQSSATAGSQTFERGEIGKRVVKRGLSALPFGIGSFAEGMQKAGAERVQEKLAYLLANPDEARRVLAALEPKQRSAVSRALAAASAQSGRAGAVSYGQTR